MSRLIFDISKTVLFALVMMHLVVFDGKSLLCHVIGLFYSGTWVAIVQEILQHKLKYFGNICCLVFVICVAWRINRHGRPRPASRAWRHISVTQPIEKSDASCTAMVTVESTHKSVECKASSSSPVFHSEFDLTTQASTFSACVDSLIDSSLQTQPDESRDTSSSSASSEEILPVEEEAMQVIVSEVGSCVDVIDDEHKAVPVPVRLTKTRLVVAAGVVGLGGYLCWRLLKR